MNINKNFKNFLITLLAITTILSISWYVSRSQSRAAASNAAIVQSASVQEQSASQAGSPPNIQDIRTQTTSGITLTVTSVKIIATGIQVGVCYSTPDGGDWYQSPGHLFFSTYEILPDEAEMTSEQKADGVAMGKRCEDIRYRISDLKSITTPIKFSVINIFAATREMPPCDYFQLRLSTSPAARAAGIKATCIANSDGSVSATLSNDLATASMADAQKILQDVLSGEVEGPWAFTINTLNP
jgi:hypothetical protein